MLNAPPKMPPLEMVGPGAATMSDTGTTIGELDAPVADTVMVPAYVPAASVAALADTWMEALPAPFAGVTFSQLPPEVVAARAVHVRVPPPAFEIARFWD